MTDDPLRACPFCRPPAEQVLAASERSFAIRDAFPVAAGHSLVVPRRHVAAFFDLSDDEQADSWALVRAVRRSLELELAPDGFTIGLNDGVAAGQTVFHAHIHVIPRRTGDVEDPRGGIRRVRPERACYWEPAG